jgi:hypothetical protein
MKDLTISILCFMLGAFLGDIIYFTTYCPLHKSYLLAIPDIFLVLFMFMVFYLEKPFKKARLEKI